MVRLGVRAGGEDCSWGWMLCSQTSSIWTEQLGKVDEKLYHALSYSFHRAPTTLVKDRSQVKLRSDSTQNEPLKLKVLFFIPIRNIAIYNNELIYMGNNFCFSMSLSCLSKVLTRSPSLFNYNLRLSKKTIYMGGPCLWSAGWKFCKGRNRHLHIQY